MEKIPRTAKIVGSIIFASGTVSSITAYMHFGNLYISALIFGVGYLVSMFATGCVDIWFNINKFVQGYDMSMIGPDTRYGQDVRTLRELYYDHGVPIKASKCHRLLWVWYARNGYSKTCGNKTIWKEMQEEFSVWLEHSKGKLSFLQPKSTVPDDKPVEGT